MNFLRFFSPLRAWRDLRAYMARRRKHEIVFLALAIAVTWLILFAFVLDTRIVRPYHRTIIYVQQWPATRTDAEIVAQQKIDGVEQTRLENELKKKQAESRAAFKRVDDQMNAMGL
ncbi:MAG TPA: hypothetical protein VE087_05010 [Xanthobacteraceae bacterium]|nr:hypothetical protein [Xanthobacteraceae bacterium]